MSVAQKFERKLERTLQKKAPQYTWKAGRGIDARSKVDVIGLRNGVPRILVEVELKKDNPVENVVKVWHWAKEEGLTSRMLFIHAFSAHYLHGAGSPPTKLKQYERAVFVGQQMANDSKCPIGYQELKIYTTTHNGQRKLYKPLMRRGVIVKEGGGAMLRAAEELGGDIRKLLRKSVATAQRRAGKSTI